MMPDRLEQERKDFEIWLRTVCFQKPPDHSKDLAWMAWRHVAERPATEAFCTCDADETTGWTDDIAFIPRCNVCGAVVKSAAVRRASKPLPVEALVAAMDCLDAYDLDDYADQLRALIEGAKP